MTKKLLAAAVAGALAVPSIAFAQVTISGEFRGAFETAKFKGATVARVGKNSHSFFRDNQSKLIFSVREDLGNGLKVYGRFEFRPLVDSAAPANNTFANMGTTSPPQWIGMESTSWGNLRFGTISGLHFVAIPDPVAYIGTTFDSNAMILGGTAIPGAGGVHLSTRTRNTLAWDSLTFSGFKMTVAYSSNAVADDNDLSATTRAGRWWNLIPQYRSGPWNLGYSYSDQEPDAGPRAANFTTAAVTAAAAAAGAVNQKGHKLYAEYKFAGGWSLSGGLDKLKYTAEATGAVVADRNAWTLGGSYATGPHTAAIAYTRADDDKVVLGTGGVAGANTGADFFTMAYSYNLSKRTKAFASWKQLKNEAAATYGAAGYNTGQFNANTGFPTMGEDLSSLTLGMQHNF